MKRATDLEWGAKGQTKRPGRGEWGEEWSKEQEREHSTDLSGVASLKISHLFSVHPWNDDGMSESQGCKVQESHDIVTTIDDIVLGVNLVWIQLFWDLDVLVPGVKRGVSLSNGAESTCGMGQFCPCG